MGKNTYYNFRLLRVFIVLLLIALFFVLVDAVGFAVFCGIIYIGLLLVEPHKWQTDEEKIVIFYMFGAVRYTFKWKNIFHFGSTIETSGSGIYAYRPKVFELIGKDEENHRRTNFNLSHSLVPSKKLKEDIRKYYDKGFDETFLEKRKTKRKRK